MDNEIEKVVECEIERRRRKRGGGGAELRSSYDHDYYPDLVTLAGKQLGVRLASGARLGRNGTIPYYYYLTTY